MDNKKQHYSIRKFAIGACSILLGMTIVPNAGVSLAPQVVHASEIQDESVEVSFTDLNGEKISEQDILEAAENGSKIDFMVVVKFPENATNRTIELKLGNFLTFGDNLNTEDVIEGLGDQDINIKEYIQNVTKPQFTTKITSPNGEEYKNIKDQHDYNINSIYKINVQRNNGEGGQTVTYTIKDGVRTAGFSIKAYIQANPSARLKGISVDGRINGSTDAVEKSIPVTATLRATYNSQNYISTSHINKISLPNSNYVHSQPYVHPSDYRVDNKYRFATKENGYEVDRRFSLSANGQIAALGASLNLGYIIDYAEYTIKTPLGVSVISVKPVTLGDPSFVEFEPTYEKDGFNYTKIKYVKPLDVNWFDVIARMKIDTNIIPVPTTLDEVKTTTFEIVDQKVKFRNFDQVVVNNTYSQRGNFKMLKQQRESGENIGFLVSDAPTSYGSGILGTISRNTITPEGMYTGLGTFGYRYITNFEDKNSNPMELYYEFPKNDNVLVEGIYVRAIDSETGPITRVHVTTENMPEGYWKVLDKAIPKNGVGFLSKKELGVSINDRLTSVTVPIGIIPANYESTASNFMANLVFGKILKKRNDNQQVISANVTLRSEGYDESNTEKDFKLAPVKIGVELNDSKTTNSVNIISDRSKTIDPNVSKKIKFILNVRGLSTDTAQSIVSNKIKNIYLALPSDVKLKDFKLTNSRDANENFAREITKTERVLEGTGKVLYTFNLDNVSKFRNYVGPNITETHSRLTNSSIEFEVDVENKVETERIVEFKESIFVEVDGAGVAKYESPAGRSGYDPLNILTGDKKHLVSIVETNQESATFSKLDTLNVSPEYKLGSEPDFNNNAGKEVFKIKDINEEINVKYTIGNELTKDIDVVDLFIPIPKKGQSFGELFQDKAFEYSMRLKGVPQSNNQDEFNNFFDISYAEVPADQVPANGSVVYDSVTLSRVAFTSSAGNLSNANLIRVKLKDGMKLPAGKTFNLNYTFELLGVTEGDDGKTNEWNAAYFGKIGANQRMYQGKRTSVDVAIGKIALDLFNDINKDGVKGVGETSRDGVKFEIFDEKGKSISERPFDTTNSVFVKDQLASGKEYTIKLYNPDKALFRFTTGEVTNDKTVTFIKTRAQLKTISDLVAAVAGITSEKTTSSFTGIKGLTTTPSTISFFDDNIVLPQVPSVPGLRHIGWMDTTTNTKYTNDQMSKLLTGKENKTYKALYIVEKATVTPTVRWTNDLPEDRSDVTLILKKDGAPIDGKKVVRKGVAETVQWEDLDAIGNYEVSVEGGLEKYVTDITLSTAMNEVPSVINWDSLATTSEDNVFKFVTKTISAEVTNDKSPKDNAVISINGMKYLSETEKEKAIAEVNKLNDRDAINRLIDGYRETNFSNAKVKAKEIINGLENLKVRKEFLDDVDNAENVTDIEDAVERARVANTKALTENEEAKAQASATIDGLTNLSDERKNELKEAIKNAKDKEAADKIKNDAIQENKDNAKAAVDNLTNLTPDGRDAIKDAIQNAKTPSDVATILSDARVEDVKAGALATSKESAKATIDSLGNLSTVEKDAYKDTINGLNKPEDVAKELKKAIDVNLDKAKEKAKSELPGLTHLTLEERSAVETAINEAKTPEAVAEKLGEAKAKNTKKEHVLALEKEKNKGVVKGLDYLTPTEKQETEDAINAATTVEEVKQKAQEAVAKDLDKAKKAAESAIDQLPTLSPEEKQVAKTDANGKDTVEDVKKVLDAAKEKEVEKAKALAVAKAEALKELEKLSLLTPEQKAATESGINAAKETLAINQALEIAKQQNLDKAKENAVAEVGKLDALTPQERDDYNRLIGEASTPENVKSVVEAAKVTNDRTKAEKAKALAVAKAVALNELEKLPLLTAEQLQAAKDAIKGAQTPEATTQPLETARQQNLDNAKDAATKAVEKLTALTPKQLQDAKDAINVADSVANVEKAKEAAEKQNASNVAEKDKALAVAKEKAKAGLEMLTELTPDQKNQAKAAIENATTPQQAAEKLAEMESVNFNNAKATAEVAINGLNHLSPEEKTAAKQELAVTNTVGQVQDIVKAAKVLNEQNKANLDAVKAAEKAKVDALENLEPTQRDAAKKAIDNANDRAKAEEETQKAVELDLANAKAKANQAIDTLAHLSDTERQAEKAKVTASDTVGKVQDALDVAKVLDGQNAKALEVAKVAAEKELESLNALTDLQRAEKLASIKAAKTPVAVQDVIDEAKAINLSNAKNNATTAINALPHLTNEEKDAAKALVTQADTVGKVEDALNGAIAKNLEKATDLATAKAAATTAIDAFTYLTPDQKQAVKDEIATKATPVEVSAVVTKASGDNLKAAQAKANDAINTFANLTTSEKDAAKAKVMNADTVGKVEDALKEAQDKQVAKLKALDIAKEKALTKLDALENLTPSEKQAAITAINTATTPEVVGEKVIEAIANDLTNAKDAATKVIEALQHLSPEEMNAAKAEVSAGKTVGNVKDAVDKAKQLDAANQVEKEKALAVAKASAKAEIDALTNIPEDERTQIKNEIDSLTSEAGMQEKVNAAKAKNLTNAKTAANNAIDALNFLTPEEKTAAKAMVNTADSVGKVDDALKAATLKDKENEIRGLVIAQFDAKAKVDALTYLSNEEKTTAKQAIEAAKNLASVEKALNDAMKLNLEKAKASNTAIVDALTYLTPEEKATAKEAIANASDVASIETLKDQAVAKDLEKAKVGNTASVDGFTYLTNEEKDAAKKEINEAQDVTAVEAATAKAQALNLEKAKANKVSGLDTLTYLTSEEKEAAKALIQAGDAVSKVEKAYEDAVKFNLEKAKASNTAIVDTLTYLTPEEKATAKEAITNASDVVAVEESKNNAVMQNLTNAKNQATGIVDKLMFLSEEERTNAKETIANAMDVSAVEKALADAVLYDLEKAKVSGKEQLHLLPNLTPEQRTSLMDAIEKATTVTQVNEEVEKAKAQDALNLANAKEDAMKQILGTEGLLRLDVRELLRQLDQATTIKEVMNVVKVAKGIAQERRALSKAPAEHYLPKIEIKDIVKIIVPKDINIKDPQNPTKDEVKAIKDAFMGINKDLPKGTTISVENGTVIITYPDGSQKVIHVKDISKVLSLKPGKKDVNTSDMTVGYLSAAVAAAALAAALRRRKKEKK